jgi:ribosome-binding protein aMBF1 (putative translation factor)
MDLGYAIHMSLGEISRIETGRLVPSAAQRQKLDKALGFTEPMDVIDDVAETAR